MPKTYGNDLNGYYQKNDPKARTRDKRISDSEFQMKELQLMIKSRLREDFGFNNPRTRQL